MRRVFWQERTGRIDFQQRRPASLFQGSHDSSRVDVQKHIRHRHGRPDGLVLALDLPPEVWRGVPVPVVFGVHAGLGDDDVGVR